MPVKRLLRRGFLGVGCVSLTLLACSPQPGSPGEKEAAPQQAVAPGSVKAEAAPEPVSTNRLSIRAGSFLFGATQEQVEFYISRSIMNFPGMVEAITKSFVPQQPADTQQFKIDQFETSNREFSQFLEVSGYRPAEGGDFLRNWENGIYPEWAETFPVVWVSQKDAISYCQWRGGWLPTEQEWEKAARGADGRYFPWGNTLPTREVANFASGQAEPVGNRPLDVSPFQVYDMGGNVAELTQTVVNVDGADHVVIRGGSYMTQLRETLTCHRELTATPDTRLESVGFRCASR